MMEEKETPAEENLPKVLTMVKRKMDMRNRRSVPKLPEVAAKAAADRMVPGEKRKRPGRGNLYDRKAAWKNARLQLLFIDDFGISRYSEEGMNILYQLVKMRADLGTSTLYTASMSQMNGVSI